jgi:DNA repair protein RadC
VNQIKHWPFEDRPREKLLDRGARRLTDAELLAIILGAGSPGLHENALDHARRLLVVFGGLAGIGEASVTELTAMKGIGKARAAQLKACLELGRRGGASSWHRGEPLGSPEDVFRHFHARCRNAKREAFYVVLLTNRNRKIRDVKISEGSLTASVVHPREVFRPVIREAAAGVVLVHNHPSGDPTPSREDVEITQRLKSVGDIMGVRVMDHVVVGHDRFFSFNAEGLL